jgi:hypothetical protein
VVKTHFRSLIGFKGLLVVLMSALTDHLNHLVCDVEGGLPCYHSPGSRNLHLNLVFAPFKCLNLHHALGVERFIQRIGDDPETVQCIAVGE